jgi:hypothetical protein
MEEMPLPPFGKQKKWLIPPQFLGYIIVVGFLIASIYGGYKWLKNNCPNYTTKDFVLGFAGGMWVDCWTHDGRVFKINQ